MTDHREPTDEMIRDAERAYGGNVEGDMVGAIKAVLAIVERGRDARDSEPRTTRRFLMDAEGLYAKFHVERTDGRDRPGGDKARARYFVLDFVHDENARAALALYADLCEPELPGLAADLRAQLRATERRPKP